MVSDLKVFLDINNMSKSNVREWEWISTQRKKISHARESVLT